MDSFNLFLQRCNIWLSYQQRRRLKVENKINNLCQILKICIKNIFCYINKDFLPNTIEKPDFYVAQFCGDNAFGRMAETDMVKQTNSHFNQSMTDNHLHAFCIIWIGLTDRRQGGHSYSEFSILKKIYYNFSQMFDKLCHWFTFLSVTWENCVVFKYSSKFLLF